MIRPERMKLVTVVAHKEQLVRLVHVLHSAGQVQLAPFPQREDGFLHAAGSHVYFPAEEFLVEIRAIKEFLHLSPPVNATLISERELVVTLPERLEAITKQVKGRQKSLESLTSESQDLGKEAALLRPMAALPVTLALLGGYESLELVAASLSASSGAISLPSACLEVSRADNVALYAMPKGSGNDVKDMLKKAGASVLELPHNLVNETPAQRLVAIDRRLQEISVQREKLRAELDEVASHDGAFIYAAEETLVSLLAKNQGTSNFMVSEYALAGRFWIPEGELDRVIEAIKKTLKAGFDIRVSDAESLGGHEHAAEAKHAAKEESEGPVPTRMRNNKAIRPFEALTEMFDTPGYSEIDPTWMLAICFPVFFGFMIGDAAYGLIMFLGGLYFNRLLANGPKDLRNLTYCFCAGGIWAIIFGIFIFGDAFAVPIHKEEGSPYSWSSLWHGLEDIMPRPVLIKTDNDDISEMMTLSVLVGWIHMTVGCAFGFINRIGHSIRHAAVSVGQWLIICGMTMVVLWCEVLYKTGTGQYVWHTILAPVTAIGEGKVILTLSLVGLTLSMLGDGLLAIVEFTTLFSNVVSFARLALVGVSKGALAVAVNTMLFPAIAGGNGVVVASGVVVALVLLHIVLILLGALSASIQSIRLHYFETFAKFFQGGGVQFVPFGTTRNYTSV